MLAQRFRQGMGGWGAVFFAMTFLGLSGYSAQAELQFSTYFGYTHSLDSDFDIVQPGSGGTNMTLHDVESDGESFSYKGGPPFYGFRGTYWLDSTPNWGFAIDYNHIKIYPDLNQTVTVSGVRNGVPVSGQQPLNNTVQKLEFTDGLNLLTFNALYRHENEGTFIPYAGAGVGLSIPHVEFQRSASQGPRTYEYQVTGVALQALAGLEWRVWDNISLFGEYKISYADVDADLDGGGSLETEIWTNHFIFGMTYRFGSRDRLDSLK